MNDRTEINNVEILHDFNINGRQTRKCFSINAARGDNDGKKFTLVAFSDITEMKNIERELFELGITDDLTNLYNRRYILRKLDEVLNTDEEKPYPVSIAMIYIDGFKEINDKYGHLTSDKVLKKLAYLLRKHTRSTDYAGRYGGDEFLILFTGTGKSNAQYILNRIQNRFIVSTPDGEELRLTFSGGVVGYGCYKQGPSVGKNKKAIEEYIKNQLQDDIASDQIIMKEYIDPFTGEVAP